MKTLVLLLVALCTASQTRQGLFVDQALALTVQDAYSSSEICDENKNITSEYRKALYDVSLVLYKRVLERTKVHFAFSTFTVWRTLAALAEGADPTAQQRLFEFLRLPNDLCTRQKFYNIMVQSVHPGDCVKLPSSQTLVFDDNVKLNQDWVNFVIKHSMVSITSSPIKTHPSVAVNFMKQLVSAPLPKLNLHGNSVILDSIDYDGLWTTAFSDAMVQRAPFYDLLGKKIGAVDLMVIKKKVKMSYVPEMSMKLLELPLGLNGRYSLLFGLVNTKLMELMAALENFTTPVVLEMLGQLKESLIPMEVAIPRMTLASDVDVRNILEDIGLKDLWIDQAMTKFVSEPAALPSSYVQHASVTLNVHGLTPPPQVQEPSYNASTGLDPELGQDFIADRPFLFALINKETYTYVLTGAYAQPTYKY